MEKTAYQSVHQKYQKHNVQTQAVARYGVFKKENFKRTNESSPRKQRFAF